MNLSRCEKAYIAGFLDGDGSIYVRLKPNSTYKYYFQISPAIVFYQSEKGKQHLEWLKKLIGKGYLRKRKDKIVEYTIGDIESIKEILKNLLPYLKLKQRQAHLLLEILKLKENLKKAEDFLKIAEKIDKFEEINYSKKRKQNSLKVKEIFKKKGLLAP